MGVFRSRSFLRLQPSCWRGGGEVIAEVLLTQWVEIHRTNHSLRSESPRGRNSREHVASGGSHSFYNLISEVAPSYFFPFG